jgi:hypothetical protein
MRRSRCDDSDAVLYEVVELGFVEHRRAMLHHTLPLDLRHAVARLRT